MIWLRRRKRDTEEAARKLAEAQRRIVDQATRLVRLEAYIDVYGPLTKREKGSE